MKLKNIKVTTRQNIIELMFVIGDRFEAVEFDIMQKPDVVADRLELLARNIRRLGVEKTPAAKWREEGKEDPHGDQYNCKRANLTMGNLTDDEMANAVYLNPSIATLTAAKERIRWLSRELEKRIRS